jgi:type IV secretory pathway VirJ component
MWSTRRLVRALLLAAAVLVGDARAQSAAPGVAALPLVELPASGPATASFAVILSGDGGWAGMDKEIASQLSAIGVPVVGWDSLRYYWTARTPVGLSQDLHRVLRHYAAQWRKSRAFVIGYSQGADVLAFGVNRLPPATRALVVENVLIAPGRTATWEFHVGNWLSAPADGDPILPEATKLDAAHMLCIQGRDETNSLCPLLMGRDVAVLSLPGGHHFNGDYTQVAAAVVARLKGR